MVLADVAAGESRVPPMRSLLQLAPKTLVWLAAVMVSLQSLPAAACYCATASQQKNDAEQRQSLSNPCCLTAGSCCASTHTQRHSCCETSYQVPAKCSCQTTGVCSCQPHNSSSPDPQAPPEDGRQLVHLATQPTAAVSLYLDDFRGSTSPSYGTWPSARSGLERCIILCRFTL